MTVVVMLAAAVLLLVGFNLLVDPYDVLRTSALRPSVALNERFNKVAHLIAQPRRYDSFVIGSSAMGGYDPADLERLRPGARYYNLAVFSGGPSDATRMLRAIEASGVHVREVLLGIDVFTYTEATEIRNPSFEHHPAVTGESAARFWIRQLLTASFYPGMWKLLDNLRGESPIRFDLGTTGRWHATAYDARIASDEDAFVRAMHKTNGREPAAARRAWAERRFAELAELARFLEERGIRRMVFIHPWHASERAKLRAEAMAEFRARIRAIFPEVSDFSLEEGISREARFFYDPKHYRPPVARAVLTKLFTGRTESLAELAGTNRMLARATRAH